MSPKCGTNTICSYLKKSSIFENETSLFEDKKDYLKIIIYREDLIDRFLSGFFEDLLNNTCYDEMDVTFEEYLLFLNKCFNDKIPNVTNLNCCLNKDIPVWFGNCSSVSKPITDENGNFCSHIMSQKYAISDIVINLKNKNIKIIELNNLSILFDAEKKYSRPRIKYDIDLSKTTLSDLKKKYILFSKECLEKKHIDIINNIYKEDLKFINYLKQFEEIL